MRLFAVISACITLSVQSVVLADDGSPRTQRSRDLPVPAECAKLWQNDTAWRQCSQTQERVCLNDLWQFYPIFPGDSDALPQPESGWGFFKVPGIWPPANAAQTFMFSSFVQNRIEKEKIKIDSLEQAWYRRKLTIPADWQGRRIELDLTSIQTRAEIFINGKPAGEIYWPGGVVNISAHVMPGQTYDLAIRVTARPLTDQSDAWWAALDSVIKRKPVITNKGLVGDIYLQSAPMQNRITDVLTIPSVRKKELGLRVELADLTSVGFILKADIAKGGTLVKTIQSKRSAVSNLTDGALTFSGSWTNPDMWDLHTPGNIYTVQISLLDTQGKLLDQTLPISFGFREFWIEGKNFILNGTPIHLRAMETRNNISPAADQASDTISRLTCQRAKNYGYNFLITQNYGYQPGQTGYADALYRAADSEGMLMGFSLPHGGHFDWKLDDPNIAKRYTSLVRYLIRQVQNHPGIVMYAMNHNTVGYKGMLNPKKMDGIYDYDSLPDANPAHVAMRKQAEDIAAESTRQIDPTRPVYHHSAGNLGQMMTMNCYLNWTGPQERGDWIEYWAKHGVKPLFFVEYGVPHLANWSSFRGPGFIYSVEAKQWVRDAEYAAPYLGQVAYERDADQTQTALRWIKLQKEKSWWITLIRQNAMRTQWRNYHEIQAVFAKPIFQDYRAQGLSGLLPWDQDYFWRRINDEWKGVPWPDALKNLQQPGITPDKQNPGWFYIYEPDENLYEETAIARAVKQWLAPVISYISGPADDVTNRACNYAYGEQVSRQVLVINDRRTAITGHARWQLGGHKDISGESDFIVAPGTSWGLPISMKIPRDLPTGEHVIESVCKLSDGTTLEDRFALNVIAAPPKQIKLVSRIIVLDPVGETSALLRGMNISFARATSAQMLPDPSSILSQYDLLIVGRKALDQYKELPQLNAVKDGLNVLFFEQSARSLQALMGFRVQELGTQKFWSRVSDHPIMNGIRDDMLHDWQGSATLYEPYTPGLAAVEKGYQPEFSWSGMAHPRAWRAGNRGNVASVLIEKPAVGDFLPLIDGAFDLRYTPLLIHTLGKGRAVFCQLDVTARTRTEPVGAKICSNLLQYLDKKIEAPVRPVYVVGGNETTQLLNDLQIAHQKYDRQPLGGALLVLGSGVMLDSALLQRINESDCQVMALGLHPAEVQTLSGGALTARVQERLCETSDSLSHPLLRAINNAELHWNTMPKFAALQGSGHPALRITRQGLSTVVYCQVTPALFANPDQLDTRDSYRRTIYLVNHLLLNMGAQSQASVFPLLRQPLQGEAWKQGVYRQIPDEVDDPYRFYGW